MDTNQTAGSGFWRYLINPDKTATQQLEELCLGLAKIISTLEPGSDNELSPQRLAAFYRAVGGNYDSLFLKPSDLAVSFMYQTLGCFHSLQPTASPFETPRIPCLTPKGFARWQTIQILLCPEENVEFIQKAVQIWNVPMPNGGIFPKYIPKEVFPSRPDEAMEEWHRMVTGKLNQKHYMQRLKNSPYQSPHPDAYERRDGYFSNGHMGGPSRLAPNNTRADQTRLADSYHRRSSVPDFPSPPSGERYSHWDPRNGPEARKTRSHSAQRPPSQPTRERSHTTSGPPPSHFHGSSGNSPPSGIRGGGSTDRSRRRSSGYNNTHYRSPARTPSTVDEDSGSEASSETSQKDHRHRASDEDPKPRRSSLWMPSFMRSHKRRHSSDASYRAPGPPPPQPLRPEYYPPRTVNPPLHMQQPPYRGGSAPQWREPVWDSDPTVSAPGTPVQANAQPDPRAAPSIRYPDQANFEPLTRESSSGSGTDHRHRRSSERDRSSAQRRQPAPSAIPSRMATLSGVHGRRYPTPSGEPMSSLDRQRSHASGRGGVATMV
ncbi:hypothetical protein HRR83_007333 [Exophiala dermatitidis]|uniref:DUF7514 domain-containing protein n=1 Tax=Exophiala dermatitidis TaxID=5970 RepID=A0AAN6ISL8_EXODE|nr:hypothetical protein HRR75_006223 [Exophiala dermatitidis]KAJ4510308.1 hypothetical protein HRR74_006780 [Exophiala dermatitidis]KAJ4510758.1 hypothetical protein HRR73_006830 [Exophiala dermatitidis]KAJ4534912.1 hypothetical protein HRR76_006817 [Exophiala dermatitidis]KAJ4535982.1 hypothetical protein HRR77_007431 [Exophiala dermatitidis]